MSVSHVWPFPSKWLLYGYFNMSFKLSHVVCHYSSLGTAHATPCLLPFLCICYYLICMSWALLSAADKDWLVKRRTVTEQAGTGHKTFVHAQATGQTTGKMAQEADLAFGWGWEEGEGGLLCDLLQLPWHAILFSAILPCLFLFLSPTCLCLYISSSWKGGKGGGRRRKEKEVALSLLCVLSSVTCQASKCSLFVFFCIIILT